MPDADGPAIDPKCPTCKRPVDAKRRCWRCCDRACSGCAKPTGSAFIELCVACGQAEGRAGVQAPAPAADQWALVFEPMPDAVPFDSRVRRLLKFAARSCKLRCAALHLPDGARVGGVIEETCVKEEA